MNRMTKREKEGREKWIEREREIKGGREKWLVGHFGKEGVK